MAKKNKNDTITIDGDKYSLSDLSENCKMQLNNIQFVDERLQQLQNELAVADTARIGYSNALKSELAKSSSKVLNHDKNNNTRWYKYNIENLDETAQRQLAALNFTNQRVETYQQLCLEEQAQLCQSLKKEMISNKAGLLFGDD